MQQFNEKNLLTFKVKLGDELRRFSLPANVQWEELLERITSLFSVQTADAKLLVKYEDDEKELVTVDSNEELAEAIRIYENASSTCIRLELFISQPILQSASMPKFITTVENERSVPGNNNVPFEGRRGPFHGRRRRGSWVPERESRRGRRCGNGRFADSNLSDEEIAEKLQQIEERGYKSKGKVIRLLKKFDGDVDQVCSVLSNHPNNKYSQQLEALEANGFTAKGINMKLLKRFEGDTDKALELLNKEKVLQESGYSHLWMNIRLLLKYDGDVEKVKSKWGKKKEKLDRKIEKRRSGAFYKAEKKDWKKERKEFKKEKKACKKEWKYQQKRYKYQRED